MIDNAPREKEKIRRRKMDEGKKMTWNGKEKE